jgi:integrase/recombinase XerD
MKLSAVIHGFFLSRYDLAPSTQSKYRNAYAHLHAHLGDPDIEAITADRLRSVLSALSADGLAQNSLYTYYNAWASLWTWANDELGIENVIRQVRRPRWQDVVIEPFTEDDIRSLLQACEYGRQWTNRWGTVSRHRRPTADRDRAILLTLLDTGLRASELCALTLADYDDQRGRMLVRHGKGGKRRIVYPGRASQRAIWRYLAHREPEPVADDPFFVTRTGYPLRRDQLRQRLRSIAEVAQVPDVHPHRFRHTFAV